MKDKNLRDQIANDNLKFIELKQIVDDYLKACEDNIADELGYPKAAYEMSKIALNALTRIQQKDFDAETSRTGSWLL